MIELGAAKSVIWIGGAFAGLILWFGRLEWTAKQNKKDIENGLRSVRGSIASAKDDTNKQLDEWKAEFRETRKELRGAVAEVHKRVDDVRNLINGKH